MSAELTTQEVADLLGVSPRYVRALREGGRLTARRPVGGQWLYDAARVEALRVQWAETPPMRGRKPSVNPSPAALAQRRSRARRAAADQENEP
jgi:excisionase family DNA binding protein